MGGFPHFYKYKKKRLIRRIQMPLWGKSTSDESRPKWLRKGSRPANDYNRVFADARGWVIRHSSGYEEVIVSIGGLGGAGATDLLGNATIVGTYFFNSSLARNAVGTINVSYNELVTVTSGATITVSGSTTGAITATAAGQTGVQLVNFTFTVPNTAQVLSINGQTISGTIVDKATATASDKVFTSNEVQGATGKGTIKTITVA